MNAIVRRLLAPIGGVAATVITVFIIELLNSKMYPLPNTVDVKDIAAVNNAIANMPSAAHLLMLLGYAIASFIGGYVAVAIGRQNLIPAIAVGAAMVVFCFLNFKQITSHPNWMQIGSYIACILFAWAGGRLRLKQIFNSYKE
jgi:hypothetical protein